MSKTTSGFVAGLLVGILLATVGLSFFVMYQRDPGGVLKLGHTLPTNHPVHLAMVSMKERLEELSGGSMTMQIHSGSVLGNETSCIEQLQSGSLSMTKTSAAAMENFIPAMGVYGLPYIFRDRTHFWNVLDGDVGKDLLAKGEETRLRGLCYYDAGSRNFYTKERPIRTPDDLKGMKIRVMNSATAMGMVKAMGGAPTPISWGELYSALESGIVDGAENNAPSFSTNKHFGPCKHFTLDGHTRVPDMLMISSKVWNRLTEQQQGWLQEAARQSSIYQRELWEKESAAALEKAKEEGVTVYEVDTALFAEKVQPMLEKIDDQDVKTILDRIEKVK